MKRIKITILALTALTFNACGNDDDNNDSNDDCQTCSFTILEEEVSAEYCDNGDGTFTITSNGESTTESLDGASFSELIAGFELIGTCD